jgi:hypothetical protein
VNWVRGILCLAHVAVTSTRLPVLFPATAPAHRLLGVLGELVQTTAGKWITHPPGSVPSADEADEQQNADELGERPHTGSLRRPTDALRLKHQPIPSPPGARIFSVPFSSRLSARHPAWVAGRTLRCQSGQMPSSMTRGSVPSPELRHQLRPVSFQIHRPLDACSVT